MPTGPLIDVAALASALSARAGAVGTAGAAADAGSLRPTLLDVRWDLVVGPRPDRYAQAHIPGAVFVDLDAALAGPAGDGRRGRHPLPEPATFLAAMRAAGVDRERPVIVYDDAGNTVAARAWWLLRHYGHEDVAVLDGGLAAWTAAGHPTATGAPARVGERDPARPGDSAQSGAPVGAPQPIPPGNFDGSPGHMPTLDASSAAALAAAADGLLLDARLPERYRGETEPVDPAAGHIPGARNRSTRDNLDPDGRFHDPATLADAFTALGVRPGVRVGAYCGSGVTAAHEVLALQLAGVEAALYPGSWSGWCADPARLVATGDEHG